MRPTWLQFALLTELASLSHGSQPFQRRCCSGSDFGGRRGSAAIRSRPWTPIAGIPQRCSAAIRPRQRGQLRRRWPRRRRSLGKATERRSSPSISRACALRWESQPRPTIQQPWRYMPHNSRARRPVLISSWRKLRSRAANSQRIRCSSDHLSSALTAASGRADVDADAYAGATELGRWARTSEHYLVMRSAYEGAIAHAAGAPDNPALARGVALAAVGSSIILNQRLAQMPTRGPSPAPARAAMQEAHAILRQAMVELWPLAQHDNPNGELTIEQTAFARAMAWIPLRACEETLLQTKTFKIRSVSLAATTISTIPVVTTPRTTRRALDAAKRRVS